MKLHLPRRRFWRLAIYLICLFLVLLAADMLWVESRRTIHPGFQTTRIISPTLPDGSVDYLAALESEVSKGVTPDNNAAPLLLQALGRAALPKNQPPDAITSALSMPHLPEEGEYFIAYEDYCRKNKLNPEDDPLDAQPSPAWPIQIGPTTREWIQSNRKPLDLIIQASKRPRFFLPYTGGRRPETLIEILLPHILSLRSASRALLIRALLDLQAGDITAFDADVLAVHRIARLLAQAPTMIERITAIRACEIPACHVDRLAAASRKLSPDQTRQLSATLAQLPDLPSLSDTFSGERFLVLDTMQVLAKSTPTHAGELINSFGGIRDKYLPPFMFRFIPIPYEASMREMNHFYDAAVVILRQPSYSQRIDGLRLWEQQTAPIAARNIVSLLTSPDWPAPIFLPSLIMAERHFTAARVERSLALITLALSSYNADHAAYPATLDELSPTYLQIIPLDLFSDYPFKYALSGNGYFLYSVGPDSTDNGGNGDDLAVRFQ